MNLRKDLAKIVARQMMFASSEEEKVIIRKWRARDVRNETGYQIMKRLFHTKPVIDPISRDSVPVESFFNRAKMLPIGRPSHTWWKVAATLAVLLGLTSMLSQFLYFSDNTRFEIVAEAGQRTEAVLPDGSKVWLNNCSRIVYEQRFGRRRTVSVEGEVFFDVMQDKTSLFIVESGGVDVRVTGTQFNVRNYPEESSVDVTLTEGAVKLKTHKGQEARMKPGETISVEKAGGQLSKRRADIFGVTAWRNGVLVFDHTNFHQLIKRLERWYNVRIEYDPDAFKDIHYTGTIRDLRLDQVFDFINITICLDVQMKPNYILLSKNQCKSS